MINEVWKHIPGYGGYYMASNLGRVKSVDRYVKTINKGTVCKQFMHGRILTPGDNGKGYLFVHLRGSRKYVHRIIANTFLDTVNGKSFVNHKDGNKNNNCVSNLEWCTRSENIRHCIDVLGTFPKKKGIPNIKNRKQIELISDGKVIDCFDSLMEASARLGVSMSNLSTRLNGGDRLKKLNVRYKK